MKASILPNEAGVQPPRACTAPTRLINRFNSIEFCYGNVGYRNEAPFQEGCEAQETQWREPLG